MPAFLHARLVSGIRSGLPGNPLERSLWLRALRVAQGRALKTLVQCQHPSHSQGLCCASCKESPLVCWKAMPGDLGRLCQMTLERCAR